MKKYSIDDLRDIMVQLRGENGCPWDKVQTHQSIKKSMIEECYEAIDALDSGDDHAFANELGDVLLQVVFHARIAEERGAFDFDDVVNEICTKLITRHTHVFGKDNAVSAEEALGQWEKNKKKEKNLDSYTAMLEDVPHYLPALMRSEKIQKKAGSVGFDWEETEPIYDKISEEMTEVKEAVKNGKSDEIEEEYGDLLFAVVNLGRHLKVTPEIALTKASDKFVNRFKEMEEKAVSDGKDMAELSAKELDELWEFVKKDAEKAVAAVTAAITDALCAGDKVQLVGFGTFEVRNREARTGKNPRTGEAIQIAASKVPAFKAGKALKDVVNN